MRGGFVSDGVRVFASMTPMINDPSQSQPPANKKTAA